MTNLTEYVRGQLLAMADAKESQAKFMQEGIDRIDKHQADAAAAVEALLKEASQLRAAATASFGDEPKGSAKSLAEMPLP